MAFDDRILRDNATGLVLDLTAAPDWRVPGLDGALEAMTALEGGAVANVDEGRRVGHYWLRAPDRCPDPALRAEIEVSWKQIARLSRGKHTEILLCGIGGSALGPGLLADALCHHADPARLHLLDNTDPEGFARVLGALDASRTLCVVVSKSGGTVETRNAMLAAMAWYREQGEDFAAHAVAVTGRGSRLDALASGQTRDDADVEAVLGGHCGPWRARLPIWDWVGGRTSVLGPVGLVPMQLCGWHWRDLVEGARLMDEATRRPADTNPAAWLAGTWFAAGNGRGDRALVVLPYRDRLTLFGRYLQQLIMESIGKRLDRDGQEVLQGLTVYGNKGSTDQHAFIQQVRDGRDDTFVHFLETTYPDGSTRADGGFDAADHLLGFRLGTGAALAESGRPTLGIRVADASPRSLGALIALFERAVGLYAELVNLNAYHQPGVEAGKRAAKQSLIALQTITSVLGDNPDTAEVLAERAGVPVSVAWRLLEHLAATGRAMRIAGNRPREDTFALA